MSAQGLEIIDTAAQTTYEWLNELSGRLDWSLKRSALRLLRATLHQIRDHLLVVPDPKTTTLPGAFSG